jgi:hypothetical protein
LIGEHYRLAYVGRTRTDVVIRHYSDFPEVVEQISCRDPEPVLPEKNRRVLLQRDGALVRDDRFAGAEGMGGVGELVDPLTMADGVGEGLGVFGSASLEAGRDPEALSASAIMAAAGAGA